MSILQKRTEDAGKIPTSNDLEVGQLAINIIDGVIYSKDSNGNIVNMSGAPELHTHNISQITGLQAQLNNKLDSTDYTASDVLEKLKTVDGTGSGLDADSVDGLHASDFVPRNENTPVGENTLNYVAGTTQANNGGFRVGLGGFQAVRLNNSPSGSMWGVAMHMNAFYRGVDGVYGYTAPNQYIPLVSLEVRNGNVVLKTHPATGGTGNTHVPQGDMTVKSLWDSSDFSSTDISNWNTAYGWGNHADAGYLTSASISWGDIDGKPSTFPPTIGNTSTTAVAGNDSRLTNAREWTATVVSQAEAEVGTATTARKWTSQRVRQAIAAWWSGSTDKTKLDGIASGATANATDAQLRARSSHTGTQAISTIAGLDTALNGKVDNTDARLSNSREWTAAVVSQAEAEAGTATTARKWTAQRVAQAISALGLKIGTTASTAKAGNWTPTWSEVSSKPAQATRWPSWSEVSSKPSTFAPSTHTHSLSQITDAGSVAGISTNGSSANFLRGDGTWATPPNTNTTYSEIPETEVDNGTSSTLRTISGRRLKRAVDTHGLKIGTTATTARAGNWTPSAADVGAVALSGNQSVAGTKTFSSPIVLQNSINIRGVSNTFRMTFGTNGTADIGNVGGQTEYTSSTGIHFFKGEVVTEGNVEVGSDSRLKESIEPIENALEKVCSLNGVDFTIKSTGKRSTGLLADDVIKVKPEAVSKSKCENEYMSVAYGNLVGLLVESIKELKQEIEELKKGT